jgi:cytoskeleton protein RodZ
MDGEVVKVQTQRPGEVLARERERQGLSRQEVAARIHMSPWQVEALEAGDYAKLPRGTFLRGFVRNYAKALGVAPDSLLPLLAGATPGDGAPRIVVPSQNIRFDPVGERLANPYVKAFGLAAIVLLLGLAGMYWWVFIRPSAPAAVTAKREAPVDSAPTSTVVAPQQLATAPVAPAEAPPPREAPQVEEPKAAEPAPAPPPAEKPAPAAPKVSATRLAPSPVANNGAARPEAAAPRQAAAGEARIHLRFKGESWVEVRDANGRIIHSKLNAPNTEADVAGKPPLAVVVGNAPLVEMTFNDQAFNLEPHTKVAVARFTLQ